MSRKRWVGAWKVNEDNRFVTVIVAVLGDRFEDGGVGARREDELGWSTHDGRLVAGKEGKLAEIEELRLENEVFLGLDPSGFTTLRRAGRKYQIRDGMSVFTIRQKQLISSELKIFLRRRGVNSMRKQIIKEVESLFMAEV